jgi:hypothetical protein
MPIFLLSAFNQVPVLPFLDPLQVRFVAKSVLKDDLFHSQICSQIHVIHDKDFHVTQDSCFLTQTELAVLSSPMFSNSYVSLSVSFLNLNPGKNMYDDHIYRAYEVRMFLWRQI